jgi:hypothetical protein
MTSELNFPSTGIKWCNVPHSVQHISQNAEHFAFPSAVCFSENDGLGTRHSAVNLNLIIHTLPVDIMHHVDMFRVVPRASIYLTQPCQYIVNKNFVTDADLLSECTVLTDDSKSIAKNKCG